MAPSQGPQGAPLVLAVATRPDDSLKVSLFSLCFPNPAFQLPLICRTSLTIFKEILFWLKHLELLTGVHSLGAWFDKDIGARNSL